MSELPESLRDPMEVLKRGQEIEADIIERKLVIAVREADDRFELAGATGTKNYVREFLLPALARNCLALRTTV